jgi:integrase/recombinase XerC
MRKPKTTRKPRTWKADVDAFIKYLGLHDRSPVTIANYAEDLTRFPVWYRTQFDAPPFLSMLTDLELRQWKSYLTDERKLMPASVNRKLGAMRSFVRWAQRNGYCGLLDVPQAARQQDPRPRWLNRLERLRLLRTVAKESRPRDIALFLLMLHCGLRVAELAALRWSDVEMSERRGSLIVRAGKGRKLRTLSLNPVARKALAALHGEPGRNAPVFIGQRGALSIRGIQETVERYAYPARIDDLTPHVLRHTFCHDLAVQGERLEVIAALAGHESIETTRRYVEPGKEDLTKALDKLGAGDALEEAAP